MALNTSRVIGRYNNGSNVLLVTHKRSGYNDSIPHPRIRGAYRSGGEWAMWKEEIIHRISSPLPVQLADAENIYYLGSFYADRQYHVPFKPQLGWDSASNVHGLQNSLRSRGAEAWNRLRVDEPDFSLGQELLELKDIPSLLKTNTKRVINLVKKEYPKRYRRKWRRDGANAYLEVQFGWLPILRSIRDFVIAYRNLDKRFKQLIRDEGKPVRRSTTLRDQYDNEISYKSATYSTSYGARHKPVLSTQFYASNSNKSTTHGTASRTYKTWAEGRFRYFLPPGPRTVSWRRSLIRRIMGLRITASELYEVFPWSFLVDYFVDVGSFMKSVSGGVADRYIADYCFLMRSIEYEYNTRSKIYLDTKDGPKPAYFERRTLQFRKTRITASPFGFGVKQTDLSPFQVSILGALGLSKI